MDLEDAVRAADERERAAADRRAAITRARQMKQRRDEAIEADANFRFYDRLMRETPHR